MEKEAGLFSLLLFCWRVCNAAFSFDERGAKERTVEDACPYSKKKDAV